MTGLAAPPPEPGSRPLATVCRNVLYLPGPRDMTEMPGISDRVPRPVLLDVSGRKVLDLTPGENDVSRLAPGVYFIRSSGTRAAGRVVILD
jgi:hypothetical protein